MNTKPRIAIIVGSTRATRFAEAPAQWILKQAQARGDMDVELVDLRDHPLPFFDELATNMWAPSQNPEVVRWQQTIARFDGFISLFDGSVLEAWRVLKETAAFTPPKSGAPSSCPGASRANTL